MMKSRRHAICMLEFAIVGFLVAAFVVVAVPLPGPGDLSGARLQKAGMDLEVLKKALRVYEERHGEPLTGNSLAPLVGRFVPELPTDPWGNAYLYDGELGLLASFGADQQPGGEDGSRDILVASKSLAELGCRTVEGLAIELHRRHAALGPA